jgi:serine/threonine protein kinase
MTANGPPPNASWQRISPGTRLNGIYEIDQPIGFGGMGEIYKGHVIETGDPVAVKLMLPELATNEAALTLFKKEASALHYVHHDAIVRYYVFTIEPVLRRPYLAMEFVDGRNLSIILQDSGPLAFEAVCALMQRLASGLQAAHERGVVHRDVSPDNIIIPNSDVKRAKIIDFGIARSQQHGTVIGSGFAGKFSYVSPEQLGLFGGDVTAKSDMYSLALVLVEALTGRPIDMGGSHLEVIEKRRKLPDLGAIDMRLRPLLEKMLQPDPDQRPESMAAVAAWSPGAAVPGRQGRDRKKSSDRGSAASPSGRGRRWKSAAAIMLLIALLGGAGTYFAMQTQTPNSETKKEETKKEETKKPETTAAGIRSYVDQYNGGDCFLVTLAAVSNHQAVIEGLGSSTRPFTVFDAEFRRTMGFDADIGVHQVNEPQCPAVTFLARLRGESARAPHLDIDQDNLRDGEVLKGVVDHYGSSSNVDLVLVSDAGRVQNLSRLLKLGTGAKTFDIGMKRPEGSSAGRQPQLLIAVTSAAPIDALRSGQPAEAAQFFPQVLSDAARSGKPVNAAARYFTLEK